MCYPAWQLFYLVLVTALGMYSGPELCITRSRQLPFVTVGVLLHGAVTCQIHLLSRHALASAAVGIQN